MKNPPGARIGLFGGSFDPLHNGHLSIAQAAMEQAALDRLYVIPCRQSPHKSTSTDASAEQRSRMIELSLEGMKDMALCRLELEREGASYSWQTAEWFSKQYPEAEIFWILGADQWAVIDQWARAERLAELMTFLAFSRGDEEIQPRDGFRMQFLDCLHPASSTAIRKSEEAGRAWLPPAVLEYVQNEGIYWT